MKNVLLWVVIGGMFAGVVEAASTVSSYATPKLVSEINTALANPSTDTLAVSGKTTLSGELEVNDSDVDINLTGTTDEIDITQTNTTGASNVPLININDARTGANADTAAEATLVITSAGAYGLAILDGIVAIEGEIDCTGDMTLDPAGNDLIVDATVDATAYTADAEAGLDTKTAGALKIGEATATKVEIADSGVETEVQGALDVNGNADFDGTVTLTGTALNVTNAQAITVAAGSYILNGIGGANDSTNTVTLTAPAAAGQVVLLVVATASTNLVTIADSGTVAASGAILLDGNDTAMLIAVDTSTWCLISESDN